MMENPFRSLPSVDRLLADPRIVQAGAADGLATSVVREVLEETRTRIAGGAEAPGFDEIAATVAGRLSALRRPQLRALVNATGVIIHTNLGRAPLAREAIDAIAEVVGGYSNLELDISTGKRGSRHSILEPLLCRLTSAEAAMAVNNNAAAVLLALSALATGREVVLSRGQLVEIGGGFRIPDVMRQSRAKLVEVGTTNRTRVRDYAAAITSRTAAIMRVHSSNFRIVGFTESAGIEELARVAHEARVLLLDDAGSGCLLDTTAYGLPAEPTPQASIAVGADVVMFSGDKLLGGPQAGLIVGRRDPIERMKRHPLARAVRLDKASIAGLAATLRVYLEGGAEERIPVWRMIAMPLAEIERRARAVAATIGTGANVVDGRSMIGGGSLPEESLPTKLVAVTPGRALTASKILGSLRARGVIARIEEDRVLLDVRTVESSDDGRVGAAVMDALAASQGA